MANSVEIRGLSRAFDGNTVLQGFAYERASSPMQLPAGTHRLEIRPTPGPIRNALFDLREITLTPR